MQLKSFTIENNQKSADSLKSILSASCPEVINCGHATSIREAVPLIWAIRPDFVFLDIELPNENGFKLREHFPDPFFDIVFTATSDQYAAKAFRMSATDYLLKPIGGERLREAVLKVVEKKAQIRKMETYSALQERKPLKVALPTKQGFSLVRLDEVVYCQASRSYTFFHLAKGKKLITSKPLKWFEKILGSPNFFRVSRSFLINLDYIQSYSRSHGGEVTLETGINLAVSKSKRDDLLRKITTFNASV